MFCYSITKSPNKATVLSKKKDAIELVEVMLEISPELNKSTVDLEAVSIGNGWGIAILTKGSSAYMVFS